VSALVAETVQDPIYLQAAKQTADFIFAHLINGVNQVLDAIDSSSNSSCDPGPTLKPFNSGVVIEGLSVLYSITGNTTIQTLLNSIVTATISTTAWQGSNGIINFGGAGDLSLVQGLTTAYLRNATTPELRVDIGHYLAVQFNAVVDLATVNGSDVYGNTWLGPPTSVFAGSSQITALSAVLSGLSLGDSSEPPLPHPHHQIRPHLPTLTKPQKAPLSLALFSRV
ncbi:hypothetical protein B0H17DRAFT_1011041, partial [Mycena rosella]